MSRLSLSFLVLFSALVLAPARSQDVPPRHAPPPWAPWRVWTLLDDDGIANWSAEFVSLGNRGTQVFCHRSQYVTGGMLLSAHDGDPPAPVWSTDTHPGDPEASDSAATTDLHASLVRLSAGTPGDYWFTVRMFDSLGERWAWTYPQITGGRSALDMSRDGQLMVVAIQDRVTGGNDLLVFTPDTPEPVVWSLPGGTIWSMDLAEEAPRVVLGLGSLVDIVDVETGVPAWQWDWGGASLSNMSLTLSADATLFAHSDLSPVMHVMIWNGTTYEELFTRALPEPGAGARCIAISRDKSVCAYGVVYPYPSTVVYTEAVSIPSGELRLSHRIQSGGAYQNTCLDLAITEDGGLVAVAQAGDATGEQPEFRIYASTDASPFTNPIFTLDLPGSALNVDIAPDGRTFVVGSREVHINELGAGGRIDLVGVFPDGLFLQGTPSVAHAGTLTLRLSAFEDTNATPWLLYGLALADPPFVLPNGAILALDPLALRAMPLPPLTLVWPYPETSIDFTLPGDPAYVGLTVYLQGVAVKHDEYEARRTTNAFPLTILP